MLCMFDEKYCLLGDADQRLLGHGGASVLVERCRSLRIVTLYQGAIVTTVETRTVSPATVETEKQYQYVLAARRCVAKATGKEFAAKRLSGDDILHLPYLLDNEVRSLTSAKALDLPRVVKLVDIVKWSPYEGVLILE